MFVSIPPARKVSVIIAITFALALSVDESQSSSLQWTVQQLTTFSPGLDNDLLPDINDHGEVVYSQRVPVSDPNVDRHQVFSLTRGQLTFSDDWFHADLPRINNS